MIDIGNRLHYLLGENFWTLKELSEQTGLNVSYLSDIQRAKAAPTLEAVEKIATAFQMSAVVFLGGADMDLTNYEKRLIQAYRSHDTTEMLRLIVHNQDSIPAPVYNDNGEIVEIPF